MFSSLSYFWGETFRSLLRNRFMALASILTVTLSMFILGVFLAAVLNINHMASYLENQVEMTIYLKDGLTTNQVMDVGKQLKTLPGLKEISFTNKDQAMAEFRERMKDQQGLLDAINGNPLPASYKTSFTTPDQLKEAAQTVAKYNSVESVQYGQDIIDTDRLVSLFDNLCDNDKRIFINGLVTLIIQSRPETGDIEPAVLCSRLKPTYTPCVLLKKGVESSNLYKIAELPNNELRKVIILLLSVFKIAYRRRYEQERDNPDKWWYWDLSDGKKINLLNSMIK